MKKFTGIVVFCLLALAVFSQSAFAHHEENVVSATTRTSNDTISVLPNSNENSVAVVALNITEPQYWANICTLPNGNFCQLVQPVWAGNYCQCCYPPYGGCFSGVAQ
jgi:hypothetical protein